jgi:hypothetical protein
MAYLLERLAIIYLIKCYLSREAIVLPMSRTNHQALHLTNPAMRRFACVFRVCTRNVPKQRAKTNPPMSALLSAEDALERSGGAPQRIAGVRCCYSLPFSSINPYFKLFFIFFNGFFYHIRFGRKS